MRRSHWVTACAGAIVVHATVLIGLKSQPVGEASPPPGPTIELAASIPGLIGSTLENIEVDAADVEVVETDVPDTIEEVTEPDTTAVLEPVKSDLADDAKQNEPDETVVVETVVVKPVETQAQETKTTVKKKKTSQTAKKKPKRKTYKKKKKKRSRTSKRSKAKKGTAGAKRSGGGRSRASAGAVNQYASRVRARILSRRPGSGGRSGTTVVVFQLSTAGGLRWARISRSSGNGALDRKAVASVRSASPFPRPPAGSRSSQLRFSILFRFQ